MTIAPDDVRHGTNPGYNAGCREADCRRAHSLYQYRRRQRIYLVGGPLKIDATGTRRRLQALVAIGYTLLDISTALGHEQNSAWAYRTMQQQVVYRRTAQAVAELYERWCMHPPPPDGYRTRNRNHAVRKGWAPPLAWDDIDDPAEQPKL